MSSNGSAIIGRSASGLHVTTLASPSLGVKGEYTESQRYMDALPALGSAVLIVFGFMHMNGCPSIPSLPAFCIVFGLLQVGTGLFKFAFRIPTDPSKQDPEHGPTKVSGILGLLSIFVAIWGFAVTIGRVGEGFGGAEGFVCESMVFMSGFISATIPLVFVIGFIIYSIVKAVRGKPTDS